MKQLTKTNLIPGLQISIDPSGLLFHLAEQTSPQELAFTLLKKYGASPLLDALKQGFSAVETKFSEPNDPEEQKTSIVVVPDPPELPDEIDEFLSRPAPPPKINTKKPVKECFNPNCKKNFILNHPSKKYCTSQCAKIHWEDTHRGYIQEKAKDRYWQKKLIGQGSSLETSKEEE